MLRSSSFLIGLLIVLLLGLTTVAQGATVVANGNDPDAVVDRDGITHLVWNESVLGGTDILHYCQIPRGGTACTNAEAFTPPTDLPTANNTDFDGPHVMVTPFGEVILLTSRCCERVVGQYEDNVVYVSDDGGLTFGAPAALSSVEPGTPGVPTPVVFDGADRRILTVAAPTGGIVFQAAPLAQGGAVQPYTTAAAQLSTYDSHDASVVQREANSFVAAWADLNDTTWVRTFTCTLDPCPLDRPNSSANWSPQVGFPDAELPRLTSGPNGTFVMYRSTASATRGRYFLRRIDGTTIGPAQSVSDGTAGNFRDVVQDAGGLLHALFVDQHHGLGYRASSDGGVTWGDQQTLAPGPDFTLWHNRVTARTVDEGFTGAAFWMSNPGNLLNPPILMAALPDPSVSLRVTPPAPPGQPPAPRPAPAPVPVPPSACRLLTFAAVDVIADACLVRQGDAYVATGGVKINGLRVELGSGKLRFDVKQRQITSSGATVTVKVGDTVLFKSAINWTLPKGSSASLGSIDLSGGGALLGFPLKGSAEVKLRGGGVEIPVHLGLPALFGGVTGDVTVRADNVAGVHLRELHVKVGDALLGPLEVKDLHFDYDADAVSWAGGALLILPPQPPGPSLDAQVGFSHGDLDYFRNELTLPGPGIAMDPFAVVYLKKIRFSLEAKPALKLSGGVTMTAGPTIAGVAAVGIDGDLSFTFPNAPAPAILRVDGKVSLVSIPLATAFFELRTNGYVGFGGHIGFEESGFGATADVSGWLFKTSFNVQAGANVCLGDLGCVGGEVVVSSTGFAGCAYTPIADFGAGYIWGEGLDIMFTGCDIGPYKTAAVAAQAGAARTVSFAAGLPSSVVAVSGQGAPPHVSLVGPGGQRIDAPAAGKAQTATSLVFHNPQTNTTYFVLKAPAAGTWTIEPAADSVAVTDVKAADGLAEPKVTARVQRGAGRSRTLSYNVKTIPGQKVTFAEQGRAAARQLGTARGGSGTLRFAPTDGPGGRRKIIAMVSSYGKPRTQLTVATYIAPPPPKPGTPKHLKARRSGTKLAVSWATARNAKRYEIRAVLSDGRRLFSRQATTRLSVPAVTSKTRATITVRALKADGTRSKAATVKVAAKKKATKKRSKRR